MRAVYVAAGTPPAVIVGSGDTQPGVPLSSAEAEATDSLLASVAAGARLVAGRTGDFLFASPLAGIEGAEPGPGVPAWVVARVDGAAARAEIRDGVTLVSVLALVIAALLMLLAYLVLRRYVIVPLHAIELAMELRLQGEEGVYADVIAQDEIGRLALALNAVVEQKLDGQVKYKHVLDTIGDGVVVLDADGTIRVVNPAAEAMFGFGGESMVGERFLGLLLGEVGSGDAELDISEFQARHSGQIGQTAGELMARRRDGHRFPVEIAVTEMETREGAAFTGVIRDISEQKAAQEALEFNNEALTLQTVLYGCIQRARGCQVAVGERAAGYRRGARDEIPPPHRRLPAGAPRQRAETYVRVCSRSQGRLAARR